MSDDKTFIFRTAEFSGMLEQWSTRSKKSTSAVMAQYSKLLIKEVVNVTPPGSEKAQGLVAKKLGENTVKNDIARLFQKVRKTTKKPGEVHSAAEIPVIHKRHRNKRGRVSKRVASHPVYTEDYNAYLKLKLASVGKLAAGWAPAAIRLGAPIPAWVKRHTSPGDVLVQDTPDYYLVRATNRVPYVTQQYNLNASMARALNLQENKLRRELEFSVQAAANQVK